MTIVAVVFWVSVALLVYTHVGYPLVLWALARSRRDRPEPESEGRCRGSR